METTIHSAQAAARPKLIPTVRASTRRALHVLKDLDWLAPLAGRLAVGPLFAAAGWGKVHDLERVTAFFEALHIPLPAFHAVLVGYSELVCGAALFVGLCTRLATLPLMVSMVVAMLTARAADVSDVLDLVRLEEFTYLMVLAMLFVLGPARISVDHLLSRRLRGERP